MGSRWWTRGLGKARLMLLSGLVVGLSSGCASGDLGTRQAPRDWLTDVADDGSLARGLVHPDPAVRRLVLRAYANLPADGQVGLLHERADGESDPSVLAELCFALGRWGESSSGPVLTDLAEHPSPLVRAAALAALGRQGDDRRLPLATAALTDPAAEVRAAAALAIFRLDGKRYDHERLATPGQLASADAALGLVARRDAAAAVRWRAVYTLGELRVRPGRAPVFIAALEDDDALVRTFALRGLAATAPHPGVDLASLARRRLDDPDARVAVEAARVLVEDGTLDDVLSVLQGHRVSHGRLLAAEALRARLVDPGMVAAKRLPLLAMGLADVLQLDESAVVRREATAVLAVLERRDGSGGGVDSDAFTSLARSTVDRDRERAARLLSDGDVSDDALLVQLLADPVPAVAAAALGALDERRPSLWNHLEAALASDDVALAGTAASVAGPLVQQGRASPRLVNAVAAALETKKDAGYEMAEARVALVEALGLPPMDSVHAASPTSGTLLDRLLADHEVARKDPHPKVQLVTTKGDILLEIDRLAAPRHAASFLELVDDEYYDGLDIHRVVPNFVVQGLDPRGDGWGTGGRRLPDEFGQTPFLTGTLGMPRTNAPHTGGCQIFMTHLPTPHLDGDYTTFGKVVAGLDVMGELEIGDVITHARRVDG